MRSYLTPRELQIVRMVVEECLDSRVIAGRLRLSIKTVETHRTNAMRKMQWFNVMQMCRWWWLIGIHEKAQHWIKREELREGAGQAGKVATQVSSSKEKAHVQGNWNPSEVR